MTRAALVHDLRLALRSLGRDRAFGLGAGATVALTVGATTAIFSVAYGVLLRPLPFRDVDRVFFLWSDQPARDRMPFNVPDFIDYRDASRTLSGLAGFFAAGANLSDEAAAERVQGLRATANLFDVLGARPRIGRLFQSGDERAAGGRVVVLTEPLWRQRFAGDPTIVGRAIRLDGEPHEVLGVLGPGFAMPVREVEFIVPFDPDRDPRRGARNSLNFVQAVGRLHDDASPSRAASDLNAIARRLRERFPVENARKEGVRMVAAIDGIVGPVRATLLTLVAAVGAVLLIACVNLANLMLVRAASRRQDRAVQAALGASRMDVARPVLFEAALIGLAGGLVGALLARGAVNALIALLPTQLPRAGEIRIDAAALLFSLAVSVLASVLFGVVPALDATNVNVREALQHQGRGNAGGGGRAQSLLVGTEVSLAVLLLVVMTMLWRSFANVQAVVPGFDPTGVLSARLTLPAKRYDHREAIVTFQSALAERLSSLPAVTHVGAVSLLPLSGSLARVPFTVEGQAIDRERVPLAQFRTVSPGYFETAGIPLKRGRTFSEADTAGTRAVAVVSEALAARWLEALDPIGARLLVDDNDGPPRPIEIVGVVGNVRQAALDGETTWDLYLAYSQIHADNVGAAASNMFFVVRTTGDPATHASSLAREVRRLDPEVAASRIRPMGDYLKDAVAPRRFSVSLMTLFALAALALAVTGIYSVVRYSAGQRAHELAIRSALGARRNDLVRLVVWRGLLPALLGTVVGLGAAGGVARAVSSLLFGLGPVDPVTFAVVPAAVLAVAFAACLGPGLLASRAAIGRSARTL